MNTTKPIIEMHTGVAVVRDDLFPGGTKARYIPPLFEHAEELVYASPACGGAQFALATVAAALGKRVTIVVAQRAEMHPRTLQAQGLGAKILQVKPGYLTVVQARAREYAQQAGAQLLPFGLDVPQAAPIIAAAAKATGIEPNEIWCAAGSGVLARGLFLAWPKAKRNVVQVGRELEAKDVPAAVIHAYPLAFEKLCKATGPFTSDLNYDAKAWEVCQQKKGKGVILFWNVAGRAQ